MYKELTAIVLGLSFTTLAQADSYSQNQGGTTSYDNRTVSNNPSDQELAKRIHDKISSGWFTKGFDQVAVQVNNGAVYLQGTVKNTDDKEKVEKEVRNIEGVKSVNSQLTVLDSSKESKEQRQFPQDTYASPADEQLNRKIRDNVSRGWLWNSYKDVALNTSNGVVTLVGTVGSENDAQKLIAEILKVEGVRSVKSNLTLKN